MCLTIYLLICLICMGAEGTAYGSRSILYRIQMDQACHCQSCHVTGGEQSSFLRFVWWAEACMLDVEMCLQGLQPVRSEDQVSRQGTCKSASNLQLSHIHRAKPLAHLPALCIMKIKLRHMCSSLK